MRLALAGGGTGGHVYPAVSVVEALQRECEKVDVLWLGVPGGPEERVARAKSWQFAPVGAAKVRGTGARAPLAAAASIISAVGAARQLRHFSAQVLLATGGYVSC